MNNVKEQIDTQVYNQVGRSNRGSSLLMRLMVKSVVLKSGFKSQLKFIQSWLKSKDQINE
jgi:predicted proteasome-type protease